MNDALAVYFLEATIASAFVARWCAMQRVEIVDGAHQVRNDERTPRIGAALTVTGFIVQATGTFVPAAR